LIEEQREKGERRRAKGCYRHPIFIAMDAIHGKK